MVETVDGVVSLEELILYKSFNKANGSGIVLLQARQNAVSKANEAEMIF